MDGSGASSGEGCVEIVKDLRHFLRQPKSSLWHLLFKSEEVVYG